MLYRDLRRAVYCLSVQCYVVMGQAMSRHPANYKCVLYEGSLHEAQTC